MDFGIKACCEAFSVSRSGYYQWQKDEAGPRAQANRRLGEQIGEVFAAHKGRYGSPRVTRALRGSGVRCGENRVARLMRALGSRGAAQTGLPAAHDPRGSGCRPEPD
jgi:putative transposase